MTKQKSLFAHDWCPAAFGIIFVASPETRKSLPPKATRALRLGGLAQPAPGASEPPNTKKKRDPSLAGSLKSCPEKEGEPLSADGLMVDSTISEWHREKRRKPTTEEAAMINSAPIPGCPFGSRISKGSKPIANG